MRILVDTNVWIDHLRTTDPVLVDLLERDQVCVHQSVITELALGNLKDRSIFLGALERLLIVRNVDDQGVRHFIEVCRCDEAGAGSREGVVRPRASGESRRSVCVSKRGILLEYQGTLTVAVRVPVVDCAGPSPTRLV